MAWRKIEEKKPKQNQWVVIPWPGGFKCGQYDSKHPFGAVVIDRQTGKYYSGFEFWMPLNRPKGGKVIGQVPVQ